MTTHFGPGQSIIDIGGVLQYQASQSFGAAPWWLSGGIASANCIAAYQPKGAASLAASYINLANPGTYNCTLGVAPALNASGWNFSLGNRLNTNVVHASGWSAFVQFSNYVSGQRSQFGGGTNNATFMGMSIASPNGNVYVSNGGETNFPVVSFTAGNLAVAGNKAYKNGADAGVTIPAWSGTNTNSIYIGSYNVSGTFYYPFIGSIQAFAIYNTVITPTQAALLAAAMAAL